MQNHEVTPAFEMLLDKIDDFIKVLNQEGAQLLTVGQYDEARALIEKVESITAIHDKIQSLQDEWHNLRISDDKRSQKKPNLTTKRLKKGLRTPEEAFKLPILQTIIEMGGDGKVSEILDRMELNLKPILNEYDYQLMKATKQPRWRTTAKWTRQALVDEGKLASDSPRGVWAITPQGRAWVDEQTKEGSSQKPSANQPGVKVADKKQDREDRSVTLEQIIEVCHEIYHNGKDYNEAVKRVADRRGLKSIHTVYDKCTRQLGLTTAEFKDLAEDKFTLMKFLIDQFPKDQYYIIEQLGS